MAAITGTQQLLQDIQQTVAYITSIASDDEEAHAEEDRLHQQVLRRIAEGAADPAQLAAAALETTKLDFSRWYA